MKSDVYTREWFDSHYQYADEYRAMADTLFDVFRPRFAFDVGCGVGLLIDRLGELGVSAYGCDGSEVARDAAPGSIRPFISIVDLTEPAPYRRNDAFADYDLVICAEVAEHLEEKYADLLVSYVTSKRKDGGYIFFTAATPGQGGLDHVNERPHEYWIEKFGHRGLKVDRMRMPYLRIELARVCPRMTWMGRNTMVFR